MASSSSASAVRTILVLSEQEHPKVAFSQGIKAFTQWDDFLAYLYKHLKDVDGFRLHIPGSYLNKLLAANIQNIAQVHSINSYDDTDDARRASNDRLVVTLNEAEKFEFYLTRQLESQLENDENGAVLDLSGSMNASAAPNIIQSKRNRLHEKSRRDSDDGSSETKRFAWAAEYAPSLPIMNLHLEELLSMVRQPNNDDEFVKSYLDNQWR